MLERSEQHYTAGWLHRSVLQEPHSLSAARSQLSAEFHSLQGERVTPWPMSVEDLGPKQKDPRSGSPSIIGMQ